MVQRPTNPSPPTAIAIRGGQGQGKSFLFKFMKKILGSAAREIASADRLFGRFNRPLAGVTLVGAEEAIFSGDPSLAQVLKTFISSDLWIYEEKYKATVEMKNVHRLIATTNSDHAVLIEDDDRRWTVIAVPQNWDISTEDGRQSAWEFWQPFYDFMDGDGPAIVLQHLLAVEVDKGLINFAHINAAKAQDKIMSDPVLQFLDETAETLSLPHDRNGMGIASIQSIVKDIQARSTQARHMTPEELSSRIRTLVPDAETSRRAHFVERVQTDKDGQIQYFEKTRQRGIAFGDPGAFRRAVSRVTQRIYDGGDDSLVKWRPWSMRVGGPSGGPEYMAQDVPGLEEDREYPF